MIDGVPETLDFLRGLVSGCPQTSTWSLHSINAALPGTSSTLVTCWLDENKLVGICMPLSLWMQGKKLVFVTNNSTKSRAGYLKKFTGLGLNVSAVCCLDSEKP